VIGRAVDRVLAQGLLARGSKGCLS
jgi:hypothetical protein